MNGLFMELFFNDGFPFRTFYRNLQAAIQPIFYVFEVYSYRSRTFNWWAAGCAR